MRFMIVLVLAVLTNSCETKKENTTKPNERLLYFNTETVMEIEKLSEEEYQEIGSEHFNDKTDTIKYLDKEIYISYLSFVTGCASYLGDIQIKGDSIILDPVNTNDYVCTEQTCDRVVFRIENKDNKRYKIKKW